MIKQILILFCIVILSSCAKKNTREISPENAVDKEMSEVEQLSFEDVIPEGLSDSLKTQIMMDWVSKIELDTTLIGEKYTDTNGVYIFALYRNDTLVRITRTNNKNLKTKYNEFDNHQSTTYYFLKDTIIGSIFKCSSFQQTGRCNPVSLSSLTYFYKDRIIYEEHRDNVGIYWSCGCGPGFYSNLSSSNPEDKLIDNMYKEIKRLKEIVHY